MKMNSKLVQGQVVLALLALAACGAQPSSSTSGGGATAGASATNGGSATGGQGTGSGGGSTGGTSTAPTVLSNTPLSGAAAVPLNASISATFSEAMEMATLTSATFTLTSGSPAVAVPGTVVYGSSKAVFLPAAQLAASASFTATITTGAKSASGIALAASYSWTFATGSTEVPGVPVDLATASQYVIFAETGISTGTPSTITGNLGIYPAAATAITGFSLTLPTGGAFSTSSQVVGDVYAPGYAAPTPANLLTAMNDMGTAFTAAAGRAPGVTELGAGDISGLTLPAGVYGWSTGLLLSTDVTLTGSSTDVWIFQVAQDLTVANGVQLVLAGGALAQNVFWQVSGDVTLGTTVQFEGIILGQTLISMNTGASITGRLFAQTAVTLDANTVVAPQ
jgi:hypothetical protein